MNSIEPPEKGKKITNRSKVEQALKLSESNLQTLINTKNESIWSLDKNYRLIICNDFFRQAYLAAYNIELQVGLNLMDLLSPELRESWGPKYDAVLSGKKVTFEFNERIGEKQTYFEVHLNPIFSDNQVTGVSALSIDISERKRAEMAALESRNRVNRQRNALVALALESAIAYGDVPKAMERITELISEALEVGRCSIWLLSDNKEELQCISLFQANDKSHGKSPNLLAANYPRYFEALNSGGYINAHDARADSRTSEFAEGYLIPVGITSMLDVAIMLEGGLAGVICLEHIGEKRKWNPDEEAFANTIASLAAQTFTNAERAKSEKELIAERTLLRTIIDLLPAFVYAKDRDSKFLVANVSCAQYMAAGSPQELIGKSDFDYYPYELSHEYRTAELEVLDGRPIINQEDGSFEPGGRKHILLTTKVPLVSNDGDIIGLAGTSLDITDRKRAEIFQRIQFNIAREVVLAESLVEMVTTVKNELNRLLDTTNFFVALFNPESDTLRKVIFVDEMDSFVEWKVQGTFSGQVVRLAKTILLNGSEIMEFAVNKSLDIQGSLPESWLGVPLIIENRVKGVMVVQSYHTPQAYNQASAVLLERIARELSLYIERRKMIDDLVVAKEKAEESDRLKSAFLANMSHEIRTPLNSIIGFSELLNEDFTDLEDIKKYSSMIRTSGDRLLKLISDIIDISKIESGTESIHAGIIYPATTIHDVVGEFRLMAERKSLKMIELISPELKNEYIWTDSLKLHQVLSNLINNALKYTDEGIIEVGLEKHHGEFLFFVKDSGIGIPPEKLTRVFDRFYQIDFSYARKYEGAGLGLSLCRGMVEMLGGKIWVESSVGEGSTFKFTIRDLPKN